VAPGFFASQLVDQGSFATDRQRQIAAEYTRNARVTPEAVVDHTLKAVDRRQLYVVLGHKARWIWRFKRAFPALFAQLIAWRYRRKYRQKSVDD
jgi:short-subunit dehydrogenase